METFKATPIKTLTLGLFRGFNGCLETSTNLLKYLLEKYLLAIFVYYANDNLIDSCKSLRPLKTVTAISDIDFLP